MKAILRALGLKDVQPEKIEKFMIGTQLGIDAMVESLALYSGIKYDKDQNKVIYNEENDRANYYKAINTLIEQNEKILSLLEQLNQKLDNLTSNR